MQRSAADKTNRCHGAAQYNRQTDAIAWCSTTDIQASEQDAGYIRGGGCVEHRIVELLRKKDEKGIELVAEHYEKLIRYISVTILGSREAEVEECINDVYLKLWNSGAGFDEEKASFKTYLKAITRNTALNYLRKIQRLEELHGFDAEENELQEEYIDYRQNVEQSVIQKEEVEALKMVLATLRKKDKELVLRRFYYLQSTRQIAQAMDMSENAVDSKLSRLRKKIKKCYEEVIR